MTRWTFICCFLGAAIAAFAHDSLGLSDEGTFLLLCVMLLLTGIFTIPGVRPNGPPPRHPRN